MGFVVWTVVATVAACIAAVAALLTVWQTVAYRSDARRQTLADAVIALISASEKHPGPSAPDHADWDRRLADAGRQLDRAVAHSILGFASKRDVSKAILELMDPEIRANPTKTFAYATMALQEMIDRQGHRGAATRRSGRTQPRD